MSRKNSIDPIGYIKNLNHPSLYGNPRPVYQWEEIFMLTKGKTRYLLKKLVELGVATTYVSKDSESRLARSYNLDTKTAYYEIWLHKIKELEANK